MGAARAGFTLAACLWVALTVATPACLMQPGAGHSATTVAALTWVTGARICHQRPERSWLVRGQQMPVCGRCAGLYVAGAIGLLAAWVARRRGEVRRVAWGLGLAVSPMLLTWSAEVLGLWDPGTGLRTLSALPAGLMIGWLVGRVR